MKIHYRIKNSAIEIVRCYGTDDRIVLPEEINGLPVVSAAPYAFSAHKDGEEDAETWESEDVISFGEERLLAGEEVQEIVFPDTLKEIGRYIFYGCKNGEAGGKRAHMVFPEHYDEAVENTPARILFTEYHGSGTNYRQCFYSKELDFAEYDSLFDMAVVMDKLEVLVDMSFGRLCHPWQLSKKAKKQYEDYIRENLKDIGEFLVESGSLNGLELLSREKLWNREGLEHSIDVAARKKDMEISAFLMNERSRMLKEEQKVAGETENERCPVKRRKKFQL